MPIAVLLAVVLLAPLAPAAAHAAPWSAPVTAGVVRPYAFERGAPFAAGRHRGVDLAARPGQAVRAPCSGRVSFAGRVPAGRRAVTVRCGALAATLLELERVRVARGARVRRGQQIARAAGGHVHLGARRLGDRHGYLDPRSLLREPAAPRTVPPAGPRGRWPREVPPPPAPAPLATPAPRPSSRPVPLAAWTGLALLAAGMPAGALWRRRGRRAGRRVAVQAQ